MKHLIRLSLALITLTITFSAQAEAIEKSLLSGTMNANRPPRIIPAPPELSAKSYVLMDANTGKILVQKNAHQKLPPASLTKVMSIYVIENALANGQINLDDPVRITKKAWQTKGSRMFVKPDTNVPVRDLIKGIIIASGNDATVALSEYVGGNTETFVSMMNQTAKLTGMLNTHFDNPDGLPSDSHYSTAYDLARLTRHLIYDFPQYYPWFKQKWFTYNNIKQPNRNRLLWRDPSADGVKTGHTKAAGFCLIASAKRGDTRLISVVMGTPSDSARARDSQTLLNYGFRFYESHKLYSAGQTITAPRVYLGEYKKVPLGLVRDFYVTVPAGSYEKLKAQITLKTPLKAPIKKGEAYGAITIISGTQKITERPLVALMNDPEGGFFTRMKDHIALMFN